MMPVRVQELVVFGPAKCLPRCREAAAPTTKTASRSSWWRSTTLDIQILGLEAGAPLPARLGSHGKAAIPCVSAGVIGGREMADWAV